MLFSLILVSILIVDVDGFSSSSSSSLSLRLSSLLSSSPSSSSPSSLSLSLRLLSSSSLALRLSLSPSSSSSSFLLCNNINAVNDDDILRKIKQLYDTSDNINSQWTIDDDRTLYEAYKNNADISAIAISLKRGIKGVENRLKKILDPSTNAYLRLFSNSNNISDDNSNDNSKDNDTKISLKPANEVITRLLYDSSLDRSLFSFIYIDRDEGMIERPLDSINETVKGKERMLVKALPEHRIRQFLYKKRVIWNRDDRLDLVFGSGYGPSLKLDETIASYDEWLDDEIQRSDVSYQLFCDLDGVLADFNDGVYRIFKKNPASIKPPVMWSRLATTHGFYSSLQLMPNAQQLWDTIKGQNPIILTGCPSGTWAEPQKRQWVQQYLGTYDVITTKNQMQKAQHMIHERDGKRVISILIDDREKARQNWEESGGIFILYDDSKMIDALLELKKYIDIDIPIIKDRLIDDDDDE